MEEIEIVQLITKARNNDEQAIEELFKCFKPKVIAISRGYFLIGADFDDLIQEGMIGLYKAINFYDAEKNHNFGAFASLCIHRQLQNAVKNANRKKNGPLNAYLPIKYFDGSSLTEEESRLKLVIVDDHSNIEDNYINNELNTIMMSRIKEILPTEHYEILKLFLNGDSYSSIAEHMNISTKKVDNVLQSIKKKLKNISNLES